MTTPFDIFSKSMTMWTDAARSAQENWMQMATNQAEQIKGATSKFPILPTSMLMDETKIRELFQSSADRNLTAWTQMAEKIAALPKWARWSTEVPGRAMTDMFDMLRPFPEFHSEPTPSPTTENVAKMTIDMADNLTAIKGIGPKIAEKLETLGIVRFAQIAAWNETEAEQADLILSLGGRIARQDWVEQAKRLANPILH